MIFQTQKSLSRLEGKLDKLDSRLDSVDIKLAQYNAHLGDHMRRTELLEKKVDIETGDLKKELEPIKERYTSRLAIKSFIKKFAGFFAYGVSVTGGIAGAIWALSRLLG